MRNGRGEGTKIEKNFVFFVFLFFLFFFCKNMKKTCTRENTPNKNETYPVINERFATGASPLVILCSKRRDNDKKTDLKIEGGGKHAKKEKRRGREKRIKRRGKRFYKGSAATAAAEEKRKESRRSPHATSRVTRESRAPFL